MARPPLDIGTGGEISTKALPNGRFEARCRFRDMDGVTRQLRKVGATEAAAKRALKKEMRDRSSASRAGEITAETTIEQLSVAWLNDLESKNELTRQTIVSYRATVKNHIVPGLGGVRLREARTGRIDLFFNALPSESVAKSCRKVLNGMFTLAARRDAVEFNPVRDVAIKKSEKKEKRALEIAEITTLRHNVIAYQNSGTRGPERATDALEIVDFMLGTAWRPGEVFALRWSDVDLDSEVPTATVTGTVVVLQGHGTTRQPFPKTDRAFRTTVLSPFVVDALKRQRDRDLPSEDGLVFPSAAGTLRVPNNFARILRAARGDDLAWISPYTFRRTAATLIDKMYGAEAAAAVLGHTDSRITRKHYIARAHASPDVSSAFAEIGKRDDSPE